MKKKSEYFSKRIFFIFLLVSFFSNTEIFADSLQNANYKTALRYLSLAENSLSANDLSTAIQDLNRGLQYDNKISDLWYFLAVAKKNDGMPVKEVISYVEKAFAQNQWVEQNKNAARLLYAELLSCIGEWNHAITILDSDPFIYSADAEYIRIKALYCINTPESIKKAREKIDSVKRVYSDDIRFPTVFFEYEYNHNIQQNDLSDKIAKSFITHSSFYSKTDAEFEIYCAIFEQNKVEKERLLKSFSARSLKHPLFALEALKAGIINENQAIDYFCNFADKQISLKNIYDFIQLLKDKDSKKYFKEYLLDYKGEITIDTNGNLVPNIIISYKRGRPEKINCDMNNDGENDWTLNCDFGVPVTGNITSKKMNIIYGIYPSIIRVEIANGKEQKSEKYNLVDDTLNWSPCSISVSKEIKTILGIDFYVPENVASGEPITRKGILAAVSSYEIPSKDNKNSFVTVSMLKGKPLSAQYYENNVVYRKCAFKDGIPLACSVDNDRNGIFETVIKYGYDPRNTMNQNLSENKTLWKNLYGLPKQIPGLYIKFIQTDTNNDSIPDFTIEYLADGGQINSWNFDKDSFWDVRYVKYPVQKDGLQREDAFFYEKPGKELVTVSLENNKPVSVKKGNVKYTVNKGILKKFYWLGKKGSENIEKKVFQNLNQQDAQGVSILITDESEHIIQAVEVEDLIFARYIEVSKNTKQ